MNEPYKTFNIQVTLKDNTCLVTRQYATTIWHAIEKAITKFREVQPDRTKYSEKTEALCSH